MNPTDYLLILGGALLPSLLLAWAGGFVVRRFAPAWGLVDRPGEGHKGHDQATPLGGGLAIALAVILPFLVGQIAVMRVDAGVGLFGLPVPEFVTTHLAGLMSQMGKLWTVLIAGGVLVVVGVIDDARGVPWQLRLLVQLVVAGTVVWMWDWGLTAFVPLKIASQALAVLWIVALINSFNMLDNMDGLSAGVATICAGALVMVLIVSPDPSTGQPQLFVIGFLLVLVGALVGFLMHNTPPAKLFMGDAGSYFIGFCLAIATMQATYTDFHGGRPHAVFAPLCIMAVPLYDMASVIVIRLAHRQSPFQPDRRHFSHRLVDAGLSKTQAVATIYFIAAATGVAAVFLHRVNWQGAMGIAAAVVFALAMLAVVERVVRRKRRDDDGA